LLLLHLFPPSLFYSPPHHRDLPSFPTRRSSDLFRLLLDGEEDQGFLAADVAQPCVLMDVLLLVPEAVPQAGRGGEYVENILDVRSEEHTSELQSLTNLVCRLLLEKKKQQHI